VVRFDRRGSPNAFDQTTIVELTQVARSFLAARERFGRTS